MEGFGPRTYHPLEVDEAEPLAYVIAEDDQVRSEKPPALGAGSVVELEPVLAFAGADLEDEGLVHVPEEVDGGLAIEALAALADPPAWG
jgi:hypothetical protein